MAAALLAATNKVLKSVTDDSDLLYADGYEQVAAFIKAFGGTIPARKKQATDDKKASTKAKATNDGDVSDDDRDDEGNFWRVAEGCTAASAQGFSDPRTSAKKGDISPEDEEKAMNLKAEAAEQFSEGNVDAAIAKITEALTLAPAKAMYWALRADYFLKKKEPLAAIFDADVALELNSENARALRVRGEVFRHLHKWEESARDLNAAQRVDFNDKADEMLKFVQPRSNARRDRRRKAQLAEEEAREQERHAKQEEYRKRRQAEEEEEAAAKAAAQQGAGGFPGGMGGGFPGGMGGGFPGMGGMGGMPGMGGMGGGMPGMPPGMEGLFSDPDILEAMQDPDTAAKLQMLMSNPMAAMSLMGDPKVGPIIQKMMAKMGGGMGMGGGMPPGMGGMGGMGGGQPRPGAGGAGKSSVSEELD